MICALFGTGSGLLDCDCGANFPRTEMVFLFLSHESIFEETINAANKKIVGFGSLKSMLETWQHALHCRHSYQFSSFFFHVWS